MENTKKEPEWLLNWKDVALKQSLDLPLTLTYGEGLQSMSSPLLEFGGATPEYRVVTIEKELELYTLKEAYETIGISDLHKGLLTSPLLPTPTTKGEALARAHIGSGLLCYIQPKIDEVGNFVEQKMSLETTLPKASAADLIIIIAKTGAHVTIEHEFVGGADSTSLSRMVIVLAEEGAAVNFLDTALDTRGTLLVQRFGLLGSNVYVTASEHIAASMHYQSHSALVIVGSNTTAEMAHQLLAGNGAQFDIKAVADIRAPDAHTKIVATGLAADDGHIIYQGNTVTASTAENSEASEDARFLLVGETAHIDAVPALSTEGQAVDIEHRLTIAHIEDEEVFYAASRGLPVSEARELAAVSFFGESTLSQKFLQKLKSLITS